MVLALFFWLSLFKKRRTFIRVTSFFQIMLKFYQIEKSSRVSSYWRSRVRFQANPLHLKNFRDLIKLCLKNSSHPSIYCQLRGKTRDPTGGLITLCQKSGSLTKWDRMAAILSSPPLVKLKKGKLYVEYIEIAVVGLPCYSLSKNPFGEEEGLDVHHHPR